MARIYYSIEDAEEFIQLNRGKIKRIMELFQETEVMKFIKIEYLNDDPETMTAMIELNKNYYRALAEMYERMHDLHLQGCMIKDLENGLVDFFSKYNDQDVMLCWKFGENKLTHWHTIQGGFSSRQNIDVLKKEYQKKLEKLI